MSNDPRKLNDTGMAALATGDAQRAVHAFAAAAEADPLASPLWLNLAKAHRLAGDDDGERAALASALALDQLNFTAQVRMAQLEERLGKMSQAHQRWSAVIQLAASLPQTPALEALTTHARDFVERRTQGLAETVEACLGVRLAAAGTTTQRRFRTAIDVSLGRRRIYANQCAGLHYPFLPADEFFDREHFPWLDRAESMTDAIRDEYLGLLEKLPDSVVPYVEQTAGTPQNLWSALDRKRDWGAIYLWKYGEPQQPILDACPQTAALIETLPLARLPSRSPTVFFSILQPYTSIPAHTGVTNTRAIVHLPLVVPDECYFRVGGTRHKWAEGEAWAFDDTIEHEACNDSALPRGILIFDVWNPHLSSEEQALIASYMNAADAAGFGPNHPEGHN